jgi:lysophospholipase L1-like esterase
LGFSGNGQLDYEIAELMAAREAALIILDFVPNASVQQMQEKMEKFYGLIREKQPHTPILFVEDPPFPAGNYNSAVRREVESKNRTVREIFDRIKDKGDANIEFISSAPMIGADAEATVDGIHFTDLGFMRYADYLEPYIKKYINKNQK